MPFGKRSSGMFCAVVGCNSSQRKLYEWKETLCTKHDGLKHRDCSCLVPFSLHRFPKDADTRRNWISALNRKDYIPGITSVVCSLHFADGRPSEKNPYPQLNIDYKRKKYLHKGNSHQHSGNMSFRKSRPLWSYEEVVTLINVWQEESIQDALKGTVKNYHVYDIIASKLRAKGFYRTAIQCRIKVKNLKAEYRAAQALDPISRECRPSARYMHLLENMFGPKSDDCDSPTMDPLDVSNHVSQQRNSDGSSSPSDLQLVNVFHLGNSNPYFSESLQWQPASKEGVSSLDSSSHQNDIYSEEREKSSPSSEEMEYHKDNEDIDEVKSSEEARDIEKQEKPLSSKTRKELHTLKMVMQTITSQFLQHQETAEHRFYDFERERMQYEAEMEDKRMEFLREEMERQSRDEERREMRMMQVLERMLACFERLKRGAACNLDDKT